MKEYRLPPKELVNEHFKKMLEEYPSKNRRDVIPLGIDKDGKIIYKKISELEDILIGGSTGSGKTNLLNNIICSILMKHTPDETKLVLIDSKGTEFSTYANLPHLITPIVRTKDDAYKILNSLILGAINRKKIFANNLVNTFDEYNTLVRQAKRKYPNTKLGHLPNIIIFIDDYALIENEGTRKLLESLLKINNYTGIHVICGTSIPTDEIITPEMQEYFYSRISFNFIEDNNIKFILGAPSKKVIDGENNYIVKTNDNKYYELNSILLEEADIATIADYIRYSTNKRKM